MRSSSVTHMFLEDYMGSHDVLTVIEGHCGSGEMFFILKQYFAIIE